jgi:hypothetical protein
MLKERYSYKGGEISLIPTPSGCEWIVAKGGLTISRGVELTKTIAKEKAEQLLTKTANQPIPKSYPGLYITNLGQLIDASKFSEHSDDIVDFGRFKGKKVKEVPPKYLSWARHTLAQEQKERENPPVYVICEHCKERVNINDPSEFPEGSFLDITSVDYPGARYGADCLIYNCPKCGKKTESIMRR